MKHLITKEKRKRKNIANNEKRKKILRYIIQSSNINKYGLTQKFLSAQQLYELFDKKKYDASNTKNRCLISGRGHSIYRRYGCSRHFIKQLIHSGSIPGLRKIG